MKAIVINAFTDKFTGEERVVNDIIEVNEKRAQQLLGDNKYNKVYIKLLEEPNKKDDKKDKKKSSKG